MSVNEHEYKRRFVFELLELLLRKYEQSQTFQTGIPGKIRPQLVMGKGPFEKDYNDETDFRKREWMNEAIHELESQGLVESAWAKYRAGSELERIYLQWDRVQDAYVLSGVVPLRDKLDCMRSLFNELAAHPWDWVRQWRERVDNQLSEGKSANLDLDDPGGYRDMVRTLSELPLLNGRVEPIRMFSQRVFLDSKHLERRVMKRLLSVARQALGEQRESEEEWLDLLGLARNPQTVWIDGPLRCKVGSSEIYTGQFVGGIGLSSRTIERITEMVCSARRIVTIENWTSYHQWIGRLNAGEPDALVIYTGGFPHRTLQSFLSKLSASLKGGTALPEMMHWGDIDLGGIRIFQYLKANFFPWLRPYRMDVGTLIQYRSQAAAISSDYAAQLRQALQEDNYAEWHELLRSMLELGVRLEQESIVEKSNN